MLVTALFLLLFFGGGSVLQSLRPCDDVNISAGNCTYEEYITEQ